MKKILIPISLLSILVSCAQLHVAQKTAEEYLGQGSTSVVSLTEGDVANGLKEALEKGCQSAISKGGVLNGYYKNPTIFIPFPEEANKVKEYALKAGLKNQVEDFEMKMNRAAEDASAVAQPLLMKAVLEMTIQDAWSILKGTDHAATSYLKNKTYTSLYAQFSPISKKAIDDVGVMQYWNPLASTYNKTTFLTGEKKVNPDLDKYITERTLDGLFLLISHEEKLIRKDPLARTTDLLQKVFAKQ